MKIRCIHCEEIYKLEGISCPSCGKRGGFLQEPKLLNLGVFTVHLEDTLIHKESRNEYQIKEIQAKGLMAKCTKCLIPQIVDKPIYISNTTIEEYKIK